MSYKKGPCTKSLKTYMGSGAAARVYNYRALLGCPCVQLQGPPPLSVTY
jgi:hypothetical protein